MRKPSKKSADAVEKLIAEYMKGFNIEHLVTASSLRYPPGLSESEKIGFATKLISGSASWISKIEVMEHADTIDDLVNFALDIRLINTAVELTRGFGVETPTVLRILQFMKKLAKGQDSLEVKAVFIPPAFQIVENNERSEEAVNFVINWCIELGSTEYAVRLGDLREKPGLTNNELENLLLEHISNGDIVESKVVCALLDRDLQAKEIEQLTHSAKFL